MVISRRVRPVKVGNCTLDGKKIYIQSMLNIPAEDVDGSVRQAVLLEKAGCQKAVLTLGYLPGEITDYFITQKYKNIDLEFSVEESPLGTAGSVKKAAKNFKNDFLVISGDCVCDFDLKEIYESHISSGADITIVSARVDDPREYGLISTDDNGFVESFVEKPSFKNAFTNKANTGIYVISPKVLKSIPDGVSFDFSKDLFPLCLSTGGKISVYEAEGYWCDMGDGKSYLKCQSDILMLLTCRKVLFS